MEGKAAVPWKGHRALGALPAMQRDPLDTFMTARFTLGPVVNLRFPHLRAQTANSPVIVEHILHTHVNDFTKQTRGYDQLRKVLGNGLLTSEGSFWLRQRRLAQPAFHREKIHAFGQTMATAAKDAVRSWQRHIDQGQPFDVAEEMARITLRVVGETLLSTDVSDTSGKVGKALNAGLHDMQYRMTHPLALPEWVPTSRNREMLAARKVLVGVVDGIIEERRKGAGPTEDLLGMLMSAQDADTGERMTNEQLRDEVMTMFLAGHETTAVLLSWTFALLSKCPEVERTLRAELQRVLEGREPTAADVMKLPYTNRVIKEVLRLYPPAWLLARRVTKACVIDGWRFPAMSVALISPYVLHRIPESFPNPLGFDPDRWLDEEKHPLPRGAYVPFSMGARKCIGDTFALLEAALVLATVVPKVSLSLAPGEKLEAEPVITIRPKGGLHMVAHSV